MTNFRPIIENGHVRSYNESGEAVERGRRQKDDQTRSMIIERPYVPPAFASEVGDEEVSRVAGPVASTWRKPE